MIALVHAALAATACLASPTAALPGHPVVVAAVSYPSAATSAVPDTTYRRLFEGGATMETFLGAAKARKEQWAANYARGAVADAVLARARSAPGPWKLLVVAVDGCSDSVNTVPYIARLAEQVMGVELRIVDNIVGRAVMDAHRTPDGRGATPTVILLDANYQERGCFIERPAELRDWILGSKGNKADKEIFDHKMSWYDEDKGTKTVSEIAEMIEAAGKGEVKC
ncbi:MAG: thioredoxin family protein [Gemmatimonadetes bacterium]|nr:thioredoxin family protein [Gemmatimonadota bacterium]